MKHAVHALALVVGVALLVGAASAQADAAVSADAADAPRSAGLDVGITFEQTSDKVVFDFDLNEETYSRVYYNTTVREGGVGETLVKVVFENDDGPSRFVRLHLAAAVLPDSTEAAQTDGGAKLTFAKAEPGALWSRVVNFASNEPLQATLPVEAAGNRLEIRASEYDDLRGVVADELRRVEGLQYTESDIDGLASLLENAFEQSTPRCADANLCVCSPPWVFDGLKCVEAAPWAGLRDVLVSQSALRIASGDPADPASETQDLTASALLALDDASFASVFDAYQRRAAEQQVWPYLLYAQSLRGATALFVGGGLTQFEPLILARAGVRVTVVDSDETNLAILERIANATELAGSGNLKLVHAPTFEALAAMPGSFDAVFALDSLTRAPTELMADVYGVLLGKLRIGGRWVQLAPSKSRYVGAGSPSYPDLARLYGRDVGMGGEADAIKVWYEWLDLTKLMKLFAKTQSRFQVLFSGEVGSYPSKYPDDFVFFDLLYLGKK